MTRRMVRKKASPARKTSAKAAAKTCEKEHFTQGLLTRGEAVPEPPPGRDLPPGATHSFDQEAVKAGEVPSPSALRRRRFSLR